MKGCIEFFTFWIVYLLAIIKGVLFSKGSKKSSFSLFLDFAVDNKDKIEGFKVKYKNNFLNEFVVQTKFPAKTLSNYFLKNNYNLHPITDHELLIAVTEKRSKEQIDNLLDMFREYK